MSAECATKLLVRRRKPRCELRQCEVCEEPATGMHYGGMTCAGCRAFFLRSVRKSLHTKYKCLRDNNCTLVHNSRKSCSACRYAKCRRIGMEPEWVLRAETFQEKQLVLLKEYRMVVLTDDEMKKVLSLVQMYTDLKKTIHPTELEREFVREFGSEIRQVTASAVAATVRLRIVQFISHLTDFHSLQLPIRDSIIRNRYSAVSVLRSAYDFQRRKMLTAGEVAWYREKCSTSCMNHYGKLIENMRKCQVDEPCVMLLMILATCSPDNQEPMDSRVIEAVQGLYLSILHKYVYWRYGPHRACTMYPKILSLLADAQLAGDHVHNEKHNWLEDYEYDFYQRKIPHVNPFQHYSLALRDNDFVSSIRDPYNVLQDCSQSADMVISRFMTGIAKGQALYSHTKESSPVSTSADASRADLFDLIESLDY